jgi:hypothetical protein
VSGTDNPYIPVSSFLALPTIPRSCFYRRKEQNQVKNQPASSTLPPAFRNRHQRTPPGHRKRKPHLLRPEISPCEGRRRRPPAFSCSCLRSGRWRRVVGQRHCTGPRPGPGDQAGFHDGLRRGRRGATWFRRTQPQVVRPCGSRVGHGCPRIVRIFFLLQNCCCN